MAMSTLPAMLPSPFLPLFFPSCLFVPVLVVELPGARRAKAQLDEGSFPLAILGVRKGNLEASKILVATARLVPAH